MGSLGRLEIGDLSAVFGMFQAALQAKSSCIDSLQAVVARQSEELALSWASIEKERQARGVAEEGVKALQCALDKSREELRKEMLTRRGDHHKLLRQLSCEWEVLAVLEEEQARREAAELALALTQRWMERSLLRCQQLQHQHRLQRQQLKAAHADSDARWQAWARHAAKEHEQVRQLCEHADVDLPDFLSILHEHANVGPPQTDAASPRTAEGLRGDPFNDPPHVVDTKDQGPDAEGKSASLPGSPRASSRQAGGFSGNCGAQTDGKAEARRSGRDSPLSKSSSWSELSLGGVPATSGSYPQGIQSGAASQGAEGGSGASVTERPAGQDQSAPAHDELDALRVSFEFSPPIQADGGGEPAEKQLAAFLSKGQPAPVQRVLSAPSAVANTKLVRSPNKAPRKAASKVHSQEFGGLVRRIVEGGVSPVGADLTRTGSGVKHVASSPDVPASKSAPTSPLRRTAARVGPSQGLKDLACNAFARDGTRRSWGERHRESCVHRYCSEHSQDGASRRSLTMR